MTVTTKSAGELTLNSIMIISGLIFPIFIVVIAVYYEKDLGNLTGVYVNTTTAAIMGLFIAVRMFFVTEKSTLFDVIFTLAFIVSIAGCLLLFTPKPDSFLVFVFHQVKYFVLFVLIGFGLSKIYKSSMTNKP